MKGALLALVLGSVGSSSSSIESPRQIAAKEAGGLLLIGDLQRSALLIVDVPSGKKTKIKVGNPGEPDTGGVYGLAITSSGTLLVRSAGGKLGLGKLNLSSLKLERFKWLKHAPVFATNFALDREGRRVAFVRVEPKGWIASHGDLTVLDLTTGKDSTIVHEAMDTSIEWIGNRIIGTYWPGIIEFNRKLALGPPSDPKAPTYPEDPMPFICSFDPTTKAYEKLLKGTLLGVSQDHSSAIAFNGVFNFSSKSFAPQLFLTTEQVELFMPQFLSPLVAYWSDGRSIAYEVQVVPRPTGAWQPSRTLVITLKSPKAKPVELLRMKNLTILPTAVFVAR